MSKKVFITGATGCVGHYVIQELIQNSEYEFHILARDPKKLRFPNNDRFHFHTGNLEFIEKHKDIISRVNYVVHVATDWSDSDYARLLNVEKTHKLFNYCDPKICERIIYFSTASILGKGNKAVIEAQKYGPGYVRSKYEAFTSLKSCKLADRIITLFPTMVIGGDDKFPSSHISSGVVPNLKFMKLLRFFYVDGRFHFLHTKDIAKIVRFAMENTLDQQELVLGNEPISIKETIESICQTFNIKQWFRVRIPLSFILGLAAIFRIKIGPWERYYMKNPHLIYQTVTPSTFGLKTEFETIKEAIMDIKTHFFSKET